MARGMPRPVEALPWGSESSNSTRSPIAESAVPRLIAVVVLPTPPFWLAMARTRVGLPGTAEPFHFEDPALGVAEAGDGAAGEAPGLAGVGDLGLGAAALEEEADGAAGEVGPREAQQPSQRRDGAGRDYIGLERKVLGPVVVDLARKGERLDDGRQEAALLGGSLDQVDLRA